MYQPIPRSSDWFHSAESQEAQGSGVNSDPTVTATTATTVVNNTNIAFIDAPFTTDIEPVIVPPTDQVRLTTVPVRATPAPQYYHFHWSVPGDIIFHWRSV